MRGRREYIYSPSLSTGILRNCSQGLLSKRTPIALVPVFETCLKIVRDLKKMLRDFAPYFTCSFPVIKPPFNALIMANFHRTKCISINATI